MTSLHLDTDLGGDIDDLCALAMVLNWPEAELTAVTTVADTFSLHPKGSHPGATI
jgi:inosine-uridine nucleoside N-ribohydrolase